MRDKLFLNLSDSFKVKMVEIKSIHNLQNLYKLINKKTLSFD